MPHVKGTLRLHESNPPQVVSHANLSRHWMAGQVAYVILLTQHDMDKRLPE